jgi:hypothetical protein
MVKSVIVQFPMAAMVGLALWIVYRDGRADRKYMMDLLERIYLKQKADSGDEQPTLGDETLAKRPS